MKSVLAFLSLVALCRSVPLTSPGRIVNGEEAKYGEIPYQVSIAVYPYGHTCGGSILNENYVLTAAHCVIFWTPDQMKIITGTLKWKEPGSEHNVAKVTRHSQYIHSPHYSYKNDIALIKVVEPFVISETTGFASLIERDAHVDVGSAAVISGWGALRDGGEASDDLMRVDVNIFDQERCNKTNMDFGVEVYDTQICTFNGDVENGACRGDSGGPLTVNGKIVGIASWVVECAKWPVVYTRVSDYLDWIRANMD